MVCGTLVLRGTFGTRISTRITVSQDGQAIILPHIGEFKYITGGIIRVIRIDVACREGLAEAIDSICTDRFLNMQIMLRHVHIGVSYNALDGREVYTQRLHLADIGMSAAVRRQQSHVGDGL